MLTSQVTFTAIRGDTWLRLIPLEILEGSTRIPMPADQIAELASRFTGLLFQVREKEDATQVFLELTGAAGEVRIDPAAGGIVLEAPAAKMAAIQDGMADLQMTEPRPGHPLGPLVWTPFYGAFKVHKDIAR